MEAQILLRALQLLLRHQTPLTDPTYIYESGPISSVALIGTQNCDLCPPIGSTVTGTITLAEPLPMNGTVSVIPTTATFQEVNDSDLVPAQLGPPGNREGFTFTTVNGVITAFLISFESPDYAPHYDLTIDSTAGLTYSEGSTFGGMTVSAAPGSWTAQ